mmetsp:Transcript_36006/g.72637  ORF Transcript_36006/g.72637 Transcript_36006/m.72637 type:complete len:202 (-) Transcript_36006:468-1073(-)
MSRCLGRSRARHWQQPSRRPAALAEEPPHPSQQRPDSDPQPPHPQPEPPGPQPDAPHGDRKGLEGHAASALGAGGCVGGHVVEGREEGVERPLDPVRARPVCPHLRDRLNALSKGPGRRQRLLQRGVNAPAEGEVLVEEEVGGGVPRADEEALLRHLLEHHRRSRPREACRVKALNLEAEGELSGAVGAREASAHHEAIAQ